EHFGECEEDETQTEIDGVRCERVKGHAVSVAPLYGHPFHRIRQQSVEDYVQDYRARKSRVFGERLQLRDEYRLDRPRSLRYQRVHGKLGQEDALEEVPYHIGDADCDSSGTH